MDADKDLMATAVQHGLAVRSWAARSLPDATLDGSSVSHAGDSTIGSNFCQALVAGNAKCKMQNAKCKMQNAE
jgi:hypothetical protein